ncbi:MAG: nitrate/nitrite transporter NrtS [Chloroflexi bacterium]|nr:nitrate/nitrite transporter NrtS [Chloroflexota bacterium]
MCALRHWPMLKRSLVACLVVGTILTALNQGDTIVSGQWSNALYWKIPLTYCVPLLVATYGALINNRK